MTILDTNNENLAPYEVFLSYDRSDSELASELHKGLVSAGIRVFKDDATLEPGNNWIRELEKMINQIHTFLLLRTGPTLTEWVQIETNFALMRQASSDSQGLPRIIPVVPTPAGSPPPTGDRFVDMLQRFILELENNRIRPSALDKLVQTIRQGEEEDHQAGYLSPAEYLRRFVTFQRRFEKQGYQPRDKLEERLQEAADRLAREGGYIILSGPAGLGKKWVAWNFAQQHQHCEKWRNSFGAESRDDQSPALAMWFGHDASPRQALQELVANTSRALDVSQLHGRSLEQWLSKMDAGIQLAANQLLQRLGEKVPLKDENCLQVIPVLDTAPAYVPWLPRRCRGIVFLVTTNQELAIPGAHVERVPFYPEYNRQALLAYSLKKACDTGYEDAVDEAWAESIASRAGLLFAPVAYALENGLESFSQTQDKSGELPKQLDPVKLIGADWQARFFSRASTRSTEQGICDTELKALLGILAGLKKTTLSRSFVREIFSAALSSDRFQGHPVQWMTLYRSLDLAIDALDGSFLMPIRGGELELWKDAVHPYIQDRLLTDSEWRRCQEFIAVGCWEAWRQQCDIQSYVAQHLLTHLQQGLPYTADTFSQTLVSDFLLKTAQSKALTLIDSARLVIERLLVLTREKHIWSYSSLRESLVFESVKTDPTYDRILCLALVLAMAGESRELPAPTTMVASAARRDDFLAMLGVSSVVALELVRSRGWESAVFQLVRLLATVYEQLVPSRLNSEISCWLSGQANGLALALDGAERLERDQDRRRAIEPIRSQLSAAAFRLYAVPMMMDQHDANVWEILLWRACFAQRHDIVVKLVEQMPNKLKQTQPEFAAENYRIAAEAALHLWREHGAFENQQRYTRFMRQASQSFNKFIKKVIPDTRKIKLVFPNNDWEKTISRLVRGDKPTCLIVSNEFDGYMGLALAIALQYQGERASVVHIGSLPVVRTCNELEKTAATIFGKLPLLILLGGPKAPQGIGQIVLSTLNNPSEEYLLSSEEFRGERLCLLHSQQVFVIAGNGRVATRTAILDCIHALTDETRKAMPVVEVLRDTSEDQRTRDD